MNNKNVKFKSIFDLVKQQNVLSINTIKNKKQLFIKISNLLNPYTNFTTEQMVKELLNTENFNPTNLGDGVAIPNLQNDKIINTSGCFIRLNEPIMYDSINNEPIDLVFTLLSPMESFHNHLGMLAKISRLLKNLDIQNKLRGAIDDEALFEILAHPELK